MQETIHGIVLRTVHYGDNSLIVDLFTEEHGRQSFVTSRVRSRRHVCSVSFWQPLSLVEFSALARPAGRLSRPTGVRAYYNYADLPFSPVKSTVALFLAEFLCAALGEERENVPLYRYVESSLQWFDMARSPVAIANFHLAFLMHLSRFVGVYPNLETPDRYFDLMAGCYCSCRPRHTHFLADDEACALPSLFRMDYSTAHLFRLSHGTRVRILHVLNDYYRLHLAGFPELKSLEVLRCVYA